MQGHYMQVIFDPVIFYPLQQLEIITTSNYEHDERENQINFDAVNLQEFPRSPLQFTVIFVSEEHEYIDPVCWSK